MANQNFRVKNGIIVGTAVTITTDELQVGQTIVHTSGISVQNIDVSGIITAPNFTGTATTATKLETARTFQITGDIVASPISFDGTGNVSLAATIQPDSVGLGTDTVGDYVQSIFGTSNQITVTGGTGEGSTPIISIPSNPTLPGNVTIANDLQVNRNLNVTGNITIGGTNAYIIADDFRVKDGDIVLGFTTNTFGQDVSNDTTANHGGVAVASTEGTPLVQLFIVGIETNPPTYKKIMWFKSGSFAGLNTDAWLSNYAIGIGSTQFPNGTRLAAGNVQITENDLSVVRNIRATGISTFGGLVEFDSSLRDIYGNVGSAASVLISTGAGVSWTAPFAAGLQGIQGTQGVQGITGAQGITGTQGSTGSQGIQGTQGIQGATGSQGTTGTQGIQGSTAGDATTLDGIDSSQFLRSDIADTSFRMISFYTNMSSQEDWENSPVSIRERDLAGAGDGEDRDSPNLNFHWGSRVSKSLWMGANGDLNWGEYQSNGIPVSPPDGTFKAAALRTNNILPVGGLPAGAGGGGIIQIVQGVKTNRQVISGNSGFTLLTGLSATITPRSSSNKILIMVSIQGSSADTGIKLRCMRSGTEITGMIGDASGSAQRSIGGHFWGGGSGGNSNAGNSLSMMFLDSPGTTSSLTYQIEGGTNSATAAYVNTTYDSANVFYELRTASHITLMEVSA